MLFEEYDAEKAMEIRAQEEYQKGKLEIWKSKSRKGTKKAEQKVKQKAKQTVKKREP